MKRWLQLLAIVAVVGASSYGIARLTMPTPPADEDHLTWMKREFKLTPEQAARIEKLHYDYLPICSEHCALIVEARERLATAPSDAELRAEVARLEQRCTDATRQHVREIAAQMHERQGRRFLQLVEPKITGHRHDAAFGSK